MSPTPGARLSPREVALIRINDLGLIAPAVAARVRMAVAAVNAAHQLDLVVHETLRLPTLQAEYCARGASKQRDVLRSSHGLGLAADVVSAERGWNLTDQEWAWWGNAAEAAGLTWGGRWGSFDGGKGDRPHVQLGTIAGMPGDDLRAAYATGGLYAVWTVAGALS
jgi:peptidoglycan L-alanyl-D-glutamate endopeptidase CwlK